MSISDVPKVGLVEVSRESVDGSPNPIPTLRSIVSVALAALPSLEETAGPSLPTRTRLVSYETKAAEALEQEQTEERYVTERRREIIGGLTAWKASYDPSPSFWLSFVPKVSNIVKKESLLAVDDFIERLEQARTRVKVLSVLEKNEKLLLENIAFMNSATERKMLEACELIEGEVQRLREFGPLPPKEVKEPKGAKTILSDDPLYAVKTDLWTRFEDWKKDFIPAPCGFLAFIPGISAKMKSITNRLFGDLYKDIRRSGTMAVLTDKLKAHRELMLEYTAFVDSVTAMKMRMANAILTLQPEAFASDSRAVQATVPA